MSRPRKYAEAAEAKRQVPDHFPDVGNMVGDDDSEQFDWMDVEDDEPDADRR